MKDQFQGQKGGEGDSLHPMCKLCEERGFWGQARFEEEGQKRIQTAIDGMVSNCDKKKQGETIEHDNTSVILAVLRELGQELNDDELGQLKDEFKYDIPRWVTGGLEYILYKKELFR